MQYDEKGRLTRAGAEEVIKGGGSVLVNGKLYARIENLPGEAEFAKGDPKAEKDARDRIQKQIDDGKAQLAALDGKTITTSAGDGLDDMTIVNLKELAKNSGVETWGSLSKADLITAIRAKRVAATA